MKPIDAKISLAVVLTIAVAAAAPGADSPLGSPAANAGYYTKDYNVAVRNALPKVDVAMLTELLARVRQAAAAEKPLAITNPRAIERILGLRERGEADASGFIDAGDAVYRVDAERQRMYLVYRHRVPGRVPRKAFAPELAAIRAAHRDLVERLGIPPQEVMFTDFREILSETDGRAESQKGVTGEIQAEGALTTVLRSVGGILVEGSHATLSSVDAKRLDLLDVSWPALRLSDAALEKGLRAPQESLQTIVERIGSTSKGLAVNVLMAVVLRPLPLDRARHGIEFVPSLKVGVVPQSVRIESGYRTDAGEVFYIDLIRGAPPFADVPARDTRESKPVGTSAPK